MTIARPSNDRGARRNTAVLVTGAGGEVGHGLIKALSDAGRTNIVALDLHDLDEPIKALCHQTVIGDVCDRAVLARLLAQYEITEMYHLAALLSTRAEFTPETAHDVNVSGTLNLLGLAAEQARSHGHRVRFIFPSSIAVYGLDSIADKTAAGRVLEDEHCRPRTMYGCNKLYCEALGRYYTEHYRWLAQDRIDDILDFRCLRFPGLISADTVPSGGTSDFGPEMIHAAASSTPYACFVREDARIPFMTMPDAIDALLKLAYADEDALTRRIYNVTSFNPSAGEFADLARRHFGDVAITFEPDLQRQAIIDSWPEDVNDDAARNDWGYAPKHDLEAAFAEYITPKIRAHYQNNTQTTT